jgi:integrase/recombinase XerD
MKPLAVAAQEYLALRRALGFKLHHHTWWLPDFTSFMKTHRSSFITTELAVAWSRRSSSPHSWARRLGAIRSFALHRRASDPRTEVPSPDLIVHRKHRCAPHIYSDAEVGRLMTQAHVLPRPLSAVTCGTLIGLLATTGMRVGEALALDEDDVDFARGIITILGSKFGKARHVPLHASVVAALRRYAARRDELVRRRRSPSFFLSSTGTQVLHQNFHHVFLRVVRLSGVGAGDRRRPRLHDLRHTFAVNTLRDWYRANVDVDARLPVLSTYLGHVSPSTTYWYLTATPELLALAAKRSRRAWRSRP